MANSKELVIKHASMTLNLLESLGFIGNYLKSVLEPSNQIEFLGFQVSSENLNLSLPSDKVRKIRVHLSKPGKQPKYYNKGVIQIPGTPLLFHTGSVTAPLHYRYLQQAKNAALRKHQSYEAPISLDYQALQEVMWWRDNLVEWSHRDRCIPSRLGGPLSGCVNWRDMVPNRVLFSHHLPRAFRWISSNKVLQYYSLWTMLQFISVFFSSNHCILRSE